MDIQSFYAGDNFEIYEYLGAHVAGDGFVFRIYAPAAARVTLLGDFSDWVELEMNPIENARFYELYVNGAREGQRYLFRVYTENGAVDHADPCGFGSELRPGYCSVIRGLDGYRFTDAEWMSRRTTRMKEPMNVYEVHLGSWRRKPDGGWYSYSEAARLLADYCVDAGYNYIELLPLAEHPLDESWGYLTGGLFAPTSRYGTAAQLMEFVDICHGSGIGVLLDFVPVHFTADSFGLRELDGTRLYELPPSDVGTSEWGSLNFNHSRGETASLLKSAAHYWLREYHFDGLRMDAVSRIIYWMGDESRGVNERGVEFLRSMNKGLKERASGCVLIAEDSTSYVKVTAPVEYGGLGFDYKWDMGFMNDTLNYFRGDPLFRGGNYHALTFSMMYFYSENFMLAFSHDENVHGKATIMQKMHGDYEDKFPQARAMYMYMYTHPGKKLVFMGSEIGQLREWDESREQDWDLLKYPAHDGFFGYMKRLNHIYLEHPALYESDLAEDGFRWLECGAVSECVYAYERTGGGETLAAVFNFSGVDRRFSLKKYGYSRAAVLLSSDWDICGGAAETRTNIDLSDFGLPRFSGILIKITK